VEGSQVARGDAEECRCHGDCIDGNDVLLGTISVDERAV